MNTILPFAEFDDYWKERRQLNWCKINSARNQNVNVSLPIINVLLGSQRINIGDAQFDGTDFDLGSNPFHIMHPCVQDINPNIITSITDLTNKDITQCVAYLNQFKISLPFIKDFATQVLDHKLFAQRVPSKSRYSEDIQRYVDHIQVIAFHEDILKPSKEFAHENIYNLLNGIYSNIDATDMSNWITDITDYDLTNLWIPTGDNLVGYDNTDNQFIMTRLLDIHNYIMDFTNLCQDLTVRDGTAQVIYHGPVDQSYVIFNENVIGDFTDVIQSYRIPVQTRWVLCNEIPRFFRTQTDGRNEFVDQSIYIKYGDYVYDLLRLYYGFNDSIIRLTLQLILAWSLRNNTDDLALEAVSDLLSNLTGVNKTTGYTSIIKYLEGQLSMFLDDMTGISYPVIYHSGDIDYTSDVTMSATQGLDDLYIIINQLNNLQFVYIIDFGYGPNLLLGNGSVMMHKNPIFTDTGYLSLFSATNQIEL